MGDYSLRGRNRRRSVERKRVVATHENFQHDDEDGEEINSEDGEDDDEDDRKDEEEKSLFIECKALEKALLLCNTKGVYSKECDDLHFPCSSALLSSRIGMRKKMDAQKNEQC